MAGASAQIVWTNKQLFRRLAVFDIEFMAGLERYMEDREQEVEDWMQENAPWEDRSGDARDGLTATAHRERLDVLLEIYHTVEYGIWLEVRWNGKFAIIEPTQEHFGKEIMGDLSFGKILL